MKNLFRVYGKLFLAAYICLIVGFFAGGGFHSTLAPVVLAQSGTCGDGIINYGEHCEDGDTANGDGCANDCRKECAQDSDCPSGRVGVCFGPMAPGNQTFLTGICFLDICDDSPLTCMTELGKCNDGFDNNFDGPKDCADATCAPDAVCGGTETTCNDHLDNDLDGGKDCADSDCDGLTCDTGKTCQSSSCQPSGGGGGGSSCDNDGTADAGETCSNCPYDVRCASNQKCSAGSCVSAGAYCSREDICGDGWESSNEACDIGGICKGSSNAGYEGRDCFDLDPIGPHSALGRQYGVQRCRATGGVCVARSGGGCSSDCQDTCYTGGESCITNSDCGTCAGATCTNGACM